MVSIQTDNLNPSVLRIDNVPYDKRYLFPVVTDTLDGYGLLEIRYGARDYNPLIPPTKSQEINGGINYSELLELVAYEITAKGNISVVNADVYALKAIAHPIPNQEAFASVFNNTGAAKNMNIPSETCDFVEVANHTGAVIYANVNNFDYPVMPYGYRRFYVKDSANVVIMNVPNNSRFYYSVGLI